MNTRLRKDRRFLVIQKLIVLYLLVAFSFGDVGNFFLLPQVPQAQAAQVTIDNNVGPTNTSHINSGSQTVFIDDQTGYKFYRDSDLTCVYRKTTNGGVSWGETISVDDQNDCHQIQVWYDRWTPGDTGTNIHIVTIDAGNDDIWYNRLNTSNDTLVLGTRPVSMLTGTAQGGTSLTEGENFTSITKATNGILYAISNDGTGTFDSFVLECSSNCQLAASWTETTSAGGAPLDAQSDQNILMPLPSGSLMVIQRDISANTMRSRVWNDSLGSWDGAWTNIDITAAENATYDVGFAATVSSTTGDIYLAYIENNDTLGLNDQISTAVYSGGAWTIKKQVIRYTERGITNVAIGLDKSNDDIYVAYSVAATSTVVTTARVYWRYSTDGMNNWSFEKGPLSSTPDDVYGVDMNLVSDERMYVSWFDDTDNDIYGQAIADIYPGVYVSTEEQEVFNTADSYTQRTIDAAVGPTGTSHLQSGSQLVFIDDQTGYKFYRDSGLNCVYSKTTDGGVSWGTAVSVDAQADCVQIQVWYDRWTPGDTGNNIHIVTMDTGNADIWYNRLDTTTDTRLLVATPVSMLTGSGQGGSSLNEGENFTSITKTRDGILYAVSNDGSGTRDSFVVYCATTCQTNTNWRERTPLPLDDQSDQNMLVPVSTSSLMIIQRDISANTMRSRRIATGSVAWSGWTTIDAVAAENATYDVGFSAAVSTTSGDIYLAYIANNDTLGTNDEIRTARYNGTTWASTTKALAPTAVGLTSVAIALDGNNNEVYVAYSGQASPGVAATANVLWKKSTDGMVTWSPEHGPINTAVDDIYGVSLNHVSTQRIYVTWFDNTDDDIYGVSIADPPLSALASTGNQIPTVSASTSNVYIGGVISLRSTNDIRAFAVNGITITENGTIDAKNDIDNIKLVYEMDTTTPYDCASVSYGGSETIYGSIDTNGFSGEDGVASFVGTSVAVGSSSAMCVYPVMDILSSANSSSTIEISVADPVNDVEVQSASSGPDSSQAIPGTTLVNNNGLVLTHYHWRHDNGSETTATSKTGGVEDTILNSLPQSSTTRLRLGISNEGNSTISGAQFRLEYALNPSTCEAVSSWTDVGEVGGDFDMSNSVNLTNGSDTTNISVGSGGVTDENLNFLSPNGGLRDTTSQTGSLSLNTTQFVELEYSIVATGATSLGDAYCFRVSNQGLPLAGYNQYPQANISADVFVSIATSTQEATTTVPVTDFYMGGAFTIAENTSSRNVTRITISESGTIDASTKLENVRLQYDLDNTAPYNCASEVYDVGDTQFGVTDSDGFSGPNGTSTFNGTVAISTTTTMCVYVVLDVLSSAQNAETINLTIDNPSTNVLVSGLGSVGPSITRELNGSTTIVSAILTQSRYHWRNNNGTQATATSQTAGIENTAITNISQNTPVRLRLQVSNEGVATSSDTALRLEYGAKITTCSAVASWSDVGEVGGAFDMFNSVHLTDGTDTTDIINGLGGVTNDNINFITPNAAVKDTDSQIATTTFSTTQFIETEFSIRQTNNAAYDTPYCFRLSNAGVALNAYLAYPELRTSPERDFEIQRGTATFSATSITLTAGVDYIAPSASTSAFVRITNTNYTGAGDASAGGNSASDDVTAFISNPSNITSSFTISRPGALATTTRVSWEIVEFIGDPGSDNEIIVRGQGAVTYGINNLTATGTATTGILDDNDVAVFITGQFNPDTGATDYNTGQSVSSWVAASNQPAFRRGESSGDATLVSYAVVEFTGANWKIQRAQHTYALAGVTETENITAVNSLSRTFIHTQKRVGTGLQGEDEFGHEVWLSSIGALSFYLEPGASTPTGQVSVAWVIENTQPTSGAMQVTRSSGYTNGGAEPLTLSVPIGTTLVDITNASIFTNNRGAGTGTLYPRPIAGITIASTTHYQIWRSDTGTRIDYRTEVVEWPTAGLAFHQNLYWMFVDGGTLLPDDPWPVGTTTDIGESTKITGADEPLGDGEHVRIRMSLGVNNATLPTSTKSFKLQYGAKVSTCGAIAEENWEDVGAIDSGTIWRGYDDTNLTDGTVLSTDPPGNGALVLSLSDVAGTYEEANNSAVNPYVVNDGEDLEFDWHIEQNGAVGETFYCFRMVESNGTTLAVYNDWPEIRTSSFTAKTQNWRWYSDVASETPTVALAGENISPIDLANGSTTKLRITVKETENISRDDVRFRLQYSEFANFSTAFDVVATSSCLASSTWCYFNGGGIDNDVISSSTLSDTSSCVSGVGEGCGTHNEKPTTALGYRHENSATVEYEFTIQAIALRPNALYYFRLYDVAQGIPVPKNTGETYPSLVSEGAELVYTTTGLVSGTSTEGVVTDATTTPTSIPFGTLTPDIEYTAAHRFSVNTNATEGYQVLVFTRDDLVNSYGNPIQNVTGTNATPTGWATGCASAAAGCFGYHTGDDILANGSTRFSPNDSYARFSSTTPQQVFYSPIPINDTFDMIYRIRINEMQSAGDYQTDIVYLAIPIF
jgi:hypothetical protein